MLRTLQWLDIRFLYTNKKEIKHIASLMYNQSCNEYIAPSRFPSNKPMKIVWSGFQLFEKQSINNLLN